MARVVHSSTDFRFDRFLVPPNTSFERTRER